MSLYYVRTINDSPNDYDRLFELWKRVNDGEGDVTLDFSECTFLQQNAVAFLGGVALLAQRKGRPLSVRWGTLRRRVRSNLDRNGFLRFFQQPSYLAPGNSIPFRWDRTSNKNLIVQYLEKDWIGRGWVNVSRGLSAAIVGTVWEIYANAFEHGKTPLGVFSCGQYYPGLHKLKLSVVDFGVGIPFNVRRYARNEGVSAASALRWAFQLGTSTRVDSPRPGGVGLDLLKEFVRLNRGELVVFSQDGYASIDQHQETYTNRQTYFGGTLLTITLNCDHAFYQFANEDQEADEPLF